MIKKYLNKDSDSFIFLKGCDVKATIDIELSNNKVSVPLLNFIKLLDRFDYDELDKVSLLVKTIYYKMLVDSKGNKIDFESEGFMIAVDVWGEHDISICFIKDENTEELGMFLLVDV